jgi:tetratricopeptide (TPR) repeat protein
MRCKHVPGSDSGFLVRQFLVRVAAVALAISAPAAAQTPPPEPVPPMDVIAASLGVTCAHCHERGDFRSDANPKKAVARQMIEMTRDINARIRAATGKVAGQAARVECITCHKGVPVPAKLTDLLARTIVEKGADAAVAQYKELRAKYYARDVYDFTEADLLAFSARLAESARPENTLPFVALALEFNPRSAQAYVVLSRAHVRMRDKPAAIDALKKALEMDPKNAMARGYLYQLDPKAPEAQ